MIRADTENNMKEDVETFEELSNLIGHCLDNFENVILPELQRRKGKEISNNEEPKKILSIDFQESMDEKKFLRDFVRAKTGKGIAEKEVHFEELFDHCLESFENLDQKDRDEQTLTGLSDDKPIWWSPHNTVEMTYSFSLSEDSLRSFCNNF